MRVRMNRSILEVIAPQSCKWVLRGGEEREVVVGTRVRLSRNIYPFPFPTMADERTRRKVVSSVRDGIEGIKTMRFFMADDLPDLDLLVCAERFLIEDLLIDALAIDEEERGSVAVNCGDHLRIYGINGGLSIWDGWRWANSLDDELERTMRWAFSPDFGYLTSDPRDLGTGMKISLLLHIPAIAEGKEIENISRVLDEMDFDLVPITDSMARCPFFILSNRFTIGMKEEEIIERVERTAKGIIEMEKGFRGSVDKKGRLMAKVEKAMELSRRLKVMGENSSLEILSGLRLGVAMGILKGIRIEDLDEMIIISRPAHLRLYGGEDIDAPLVDVKRASLIRRRIPETKVVRKGML